MMAVGRVRLPHSCEATIARCSRPRPRHNKPPTIYLRFFSETDREPLFVLVILLLVVEHHITQQF